MLFYFETPLIEGRSTKSEIPRKKECIIYHTTPALTKVKQSHYRPGQALKLQSG
jgi:hypothetical protein